MPSTLAIALPTVCILAQAAPTQPANRPTQPTQSTTLPTQTTTLPTQATTQPTGAQQPLPNEVQDPRTTREGSSDRDLAAEVDTRTTRDAQFDPRRARADRAQEERERAIRVQRNLGAIGLRVPLVDQDGNPIATGGTDYIVHAIAVEGYNSNVQQTQEVVGGPVATHDALFTGVSVTGTRRSWLTAEDPMEISLTLRGQQYVPLDDFSQPADASVIATAGGTYGFHPRGILAARLFGTVTTLNGSRQSDGPLFQIAPGSLQRTFTLWGARVSVDWLQTARVRYRWGADFTASTTLYDAPIAGPGGFEIRHRGFDYIQPGLDAAVLYDLDWRNTLIGLLRYSPNFNMFLVDFSRAPPTYLGDQVIHTMEMTAGLTHTFNQHLTTTSYLGAIIATPPDTDPDQRWILSPRIAQDLAYIKPLWSLTANLAYTYGSIAPRLGFGPLVQGSFVFRGVPYHKGNWSKLTFLATTGVARSAFRADQDTLTRLSYLVGGVQTRYSLTDWLGIVAGYEFRLVKFEGFEFAQDDFVRHIFFFGLSGYFATDRSIPTLETFVPPLQGG